MADSADMMKPAASAPESPEALRGEIAQTRAEMGRTIQEIKERISRQHLKEEADKLRDQAMEAAREAAVGRAQETASSARQTVREMLNGVVETIKVHPILTLLTAGLLGFLVYWLRSR